MVEELFFDLLDAVLGLEDLFLPRKSGVHFTKLQTLSPPQEVLKDEHLSRVLRVLFQVVVLDIPVYAKDLDRELFGELVVDTLSQKHFRHIHLHVFPVV